MPRGRKSEEVKGSFANKPNIQYIWQVMLDILAQQEGGGYQYTVELTPKEPQ